VRLRWKEPDQQRCPDCERCGRMQGEPTMKRKAGLRVAFGDQPPNGCLEQGTPEMIGWEFGLSRPPRVFNVEVAGAPSREGAFLTGVFDVRPVQTACARKCT